MQHKTWVEIDLKQIEQNLLQINSLLSEKTQLMTVVKSNAYGHGLSLVAKIASRSGADWLGVDSIDEALVLRKEGIKKPILLLGYTFKSNLGLVVKNDFGCAYITWKQSRNWVKSAID